MSLNPQTRMLHLMKDVNPRMRMAAGDDFAAWQAKARARLMELLGLPLERTAPNFRVDWTRDNGDFTVSKDTVIKWLGNFANYKDGKDDSYNYDGYRHQPVEEDAFSFADRLF